jgi:hypothetical protein
MYVCMRVSSSSNRIDIAYNIYSMHAMYIEYECSFILSIYALVAYTIYLCIHILIVYTIIHV